MQFYHFNSPAATLTISAETEQEAGEILEDKVKHIAEWSLAFVSDF